MVKNVKTVNWEHPVYHTKEQNIDFLLKVPHPPPFTDPWSHRLFPTSLCTTREVPPSFISHPSDGPYPSPMKYLYMDTVSVPSHVYFYAGHPTKDSSSHSLRWPRGIKQTDSSLSTTERSLDHYPLRTLTTLGCVVYLGPLQCFLRSFSLPTRFRHRLGKNRRKPGSIPKRKPDFLE